MQNSYHLIEQVHKRRTNRNSIRYQNKQNCYYNSGIERIHRSYRLKMLSWWMKTWKIFLENEVLTGYRTIPLMKEKVTHSIERYFVDFIVVYKYAQPMNKRCTCIAFTFIVECTVIKLPTDWISKERIIAHKIVI